jgi:hypothetical protein
MKPIILTEYGEALEKNQGTKETDESEMELCIGFHRHCDGWLDLKRISNTHKAIHCRRCGLRVVIPAGLKTFGDLRRHMSAVLNL